MPTPTSSLDRDVIARVERYGWYVIKVLGGDAEPPFAYTVGLSQSFGHPEAIVVGLSGDVAHAILNLLGSRIEEGEVFGENQQVEDLIDGYPAALRAVSAPNKVSYLTYASWYNDDRDYPAFQLVYPDEAGQWPGDPSTSALFRSRQPLLGGV